MENQAIDEEIKVRAAGPLGEPNGDRRWHAPSLSVFEMSGAQGDPTISDDGLGDGLFS